MDTLTRSEEYILLAVMALGENAYGITIREYLREVLGKRISIGAIYVPLDRLEKKGLLASRDGDPTPQRGGRSKRFFVLTSQGALALRETKAEHDRMWTTLLDRGPFESLQT